MFAARREHLEHVIRPALARGDMVAVRPLHRRDLRLPGRRARRGGGAHRGAGGLGARRPPARPHAAVRRAAGGVARAARPQRERRARARQVRARAARRSSSACAQATSRGPPPIRGRFRVIDSSRPLTDVRAELGGDRGRAAMSDSVADDGAGRAPGLPRAAALARGHRGGAARAARALAARVADRGSARHRQARAGARTSRARCCAKRPRPGGAACGTCPGCTLGRGRPASGPAARRAGGGRRRGQRHADRVHPDRRHPPPAATGRRSPAIAAAPRWP